jgi:hypothetical protein
MFTSTAWRPGSGVRVVEIQLLGARLHGIFLSPGAGRMQDLESNLSD